MEIKIGEKAYPLKFNQLTVEEVFRDHTDRLTATGLTYSIVNAAIISGGFVNRTEVDLSFEQVCDHVEALMGTTEGAAEVEAIVREFNAIKSFAKFMEEVAQETAKKKNQKTSKSSGSTSSSSVKSGSRKGNTTKTAPTSTTA